MFELHPRLQQDCIALGNFPLCRLLLMNDSHYPWFVLVPEREGITEIFQLDEDDQRQLLSESSQLAQALSITFRADKMNIAAIGNIVPQLHVHHVVRYKNDVAWPAPVWGYVAATAYEDHALAEIKAQITSALSTSYRPNR